VRTVGSPELACGPTRKRGSTLSGMRWHQSRLRHTRVQGVPVGSDIRIGIVRVWH